MREAFEAVLAAPGDPVAARALASVGSADDHPLGAYLSLSTGDVPDDTDAVDVERTREDLRARYGGAMLPQWFGSDFAAFLGEIAMEPTRYEVDGLIAHLPCARAEVDSLRALTPLRTLMPIEEIEHRATLAVGADVPWPRRLSLADPAWAAALTGLHTGLTSRNVATRWRAVPRLQELVVSYARRESTDALLDVLEDPEAMPQLRVLDIVESSIDLPRLAAVVSARGIERLGIEIGLSRDLQPFLDALADAPLRELSLWGYAPDYYGELDLTPFAGCRLPSVRRLGLGEYTLRNAAALGPLLQQLDTLALNGIDNGHDVLAGLPAGSLRSLSLRGSRADDRAYAAVDRRFPRLRSLTLGMNRGPMPEACAALCRLPELTSLDTGLANLELDDIEGLLSSGRLRSLCSEHPQWKPESLATRLPADELRRLELPAVESLSAADVQALVETRAFESLGYLGTHGTPEPPTKDLFERRFGHRLRWQRGTLALGSARSLPRGPRALPDLDPWLTLSGSS